MVTARDVARLANTSNAVVSYVFNNGPRNVAPATRERVLAAAAELGYRPNMLARALSAGSTRSIGLIVPDICNPFFAETARALEDAAGGIEHLLLICDSAGSPVQEARHVRSLVDRRVDALVYVSLQDDPALDLLAEAKIPVVALHPLPDGAAASTLTIDYAAAARAATTHLIEHGYRDVAILNGPTDSVGGRQHESGFAAALVDHPELTARRWASPTSRYAASQVAGEMLRSERPRAIYCVTDEQAFGVLHAAHTLGLRVPEDLAVVGLDGTANTRVSIPPLTTVQQPTEALAARAIEVVRDPDTLTAPVHELLDFTFVARRSCGCPEH
ncbi:LacI family DNA-binding transcriptional regulator [Ruania halotolerans]|uniref:LacI family DNA-binding transcriptional regulator n=1 Tax=Ruania halotolerans TaxID=2897773 RepID=UPI001E61109C|nr:LacI family DNA-binding transcriptional regulator [Ruania halotolerans]UFU05434.1 LacI family transcriptional regulator [Ruania halotolerans]